MKSYAKCFNNIHSQVIDPNERLTIQGFRIGIYDKHINLIVGFKRVRSFYGLLKETRYVANF